MLTFCQSHQNTAKTSLAVALSASVYFGLHILLYWLHKTGWTAQLEYALKWTHTIDGILWLKVHSIDHISEHRTTQLTERSFATKCSTLQMISFNYLGRYASSGQFLSINFSR